jgi:hypothetical protein
MSIIETPMLGTDDALPDEDVITVELVAKTLAGTALIGVARRLLEQAGYTASITANRIMVDGVIEAQLIQSKGFGWWQVHAVDGTPPVWITGTQCDSASSWVGCVE